MLHTLITWAANLPLPLFLLVTAVLVFISTGGVPVPISATLLLAGALATTMPHGVAVWVLLWLACAAALSGRDLGVLWISRQSAVSLARWQAHWKSSPTASTPPAPQRRPWWGRWQARSRALLGEVEVLCHDLLARGWWAVALTRLSPLATPLDIAAGALRFPALAFAGGIIPGRLLYVALFLTVGTLSGRAIQTGNLLAITGALSTVLLVVILLPQLVRRWALRGPQKFGA